MSPKCAGLELEAAGSGLVIFWVYDTVVLDSSEYTSVWLESSLECTVPWKGLRLVKSSIQDGVCVVATNESKMLPFD